MTSIVFRLSFEAAGFEVGFDLDLTRNKSDIQKSIDSKTQWTIRPNTLENDASDQLIKSLSSLAMGGLADDDTLYYKLLKSTKQVLAQSGGDPITAVVVPLASLIAVHDHFKDVDDPMQDTAAFYEFLNRIYIEERALSKQLEMVKDQWAKMLAKIPVLGKVHPLPKQLLGDWGHRFTLLRADLLKLNTIEDIVTASKEYHVILPTKKWNAPFMTTSNFLEITAEGMKDQFESAIMDPYYDMLAAAPTPKPTRFPTPQPGTTLYI